MTAHKPKPIYLLAGGRHRSVGSNDVDPMLKTVIGNIGKLEPSIAYVGVANGDSKDFFILMANYLRRAGAGEVKLAPIADRCADLEEAKYILSTADSIFIGGGDVEAGMAMLKRKKMNPLLYSLYSEGIPFFGSSAGSIILSECWIRWHDPNDNSTSEVFQCMGLAKILCDTHGEADGWEELQSLLHLMEDDRIGYGIPTGHAVCVHPDKTVEAIGGVVNRFISHEGEIRRMPDLLPF